MGSNITPDKPHSILYSVTIEPILEQKQITDLTQNGGLQKDSRDLTEIVLDRLNAVATQAKINARLPLPRDTKTNQS